jgi:hypothetical protein
MPQSDYQRKKLAVAGHCLETSHKIDFGEATVLVKSTGYMDRLVKEANEIWPSKQFQEKKWILTKSGMGLPH